MLRVLRVLRVLPFKPKGKQLVCEVRPGYRNASSLQSGLRRADAHGPYETPATPATPSTPVADNRCEARSEFIQVLQSVNTKYHQWLYKPKAAHLQASDELRRVLKFSPGLEERLFPQTVYLPHSALWPGQSDFPRVVRPPPRLPPLDDAKARYNFTRLYIDRLIGPDPLDVPSDQ